MWLTSWFRGFLQHLLLHERRVALRNRMPALPPRFQDIEQLGLYLHIPFCRQICPYCPYNKELYRAETAERYADAVIREVDLYAQWVGRKPVTSFYIGGGTPTTMLASGLARILEHVFASFDMRCDIHLESHPNDLTPANLATLAALGVRHLSIGVEALQDHHLRTLRRPYGAGEAMAAVQRAVAKGFTCVNTDIIFALPHQTGAEVAQAGRCLAAVGVQQVAAYPLFTFPYTGWAHLAHEAHARRAGVLARRQMLRALEDVLYAEGFERTSVWAFTRRGVPRYCSVTVPLYLGLGASGGSYLKDVFYLNTFNVREYVKALAGGRLPIALSLELSPRMQRAGWLYWRIYETRFRKREFAERFGVAFDCAYGRAMKGLSRLGFLDDDGEEITLSSDGAYWLHVLEDLFSIEYVSRLWGTSQREPWPTEVVL